MKNHRTIVYTAILFFTSILSCRTSPNKKISYQIPTDQLLINNLITNIKYNETVLLESKMKLIDENSKNINLSELFSKSNKLLFFFFPKNSCELCLDAEIEHLKRVPAIHSEKVIILLSTNNINEVKIYRQKYSVNFKFFDIGNISFSEKLNSLAAPFYFVADKNLKSSMLFIPDKNIGATTNAYLKEVFGMINKNEDGA